MEFRELTDGRWSSIEPFLPLKAKAGRLNERDIVYPDLRAKTVSGFYSQLSMSTAKWDSEAEASLPGVPGEVMPVETGESRSMKQKVGEYLSILHRTDRWGQRFMSSPPTKLFL